MLTVSMVRAFKLGAVVAMGSLAAACGGGGGGAQVGSSAPTVATGYFKDNNVSGLTFSSGGQSGTTDANGKFTYEVGKPVTFKLGNVILGNADGKSVVTPLDLVTNGNINSIEVQNLVRFLMMLDVDGDPSNGIAISATVQSHAANWTTVDWSTVNLDAALASIIADAQAADSGAHVLPDTSAAIAHLSQTVYCAYSGGFSGSFSGSASGKFGMMIDRNGIVFGVGYIPATQMGFVAGGTEPLSLDQTAAFIAGTTSSGASFHGSFSSPDNLSGNWSDVDSNGSGSFSGKRVGGMADAIYRFTGFYGSQSGSEDTGLFTFDIDTSNHVTGNAYSIVNDQLITISGSISGTTLTATTSTNVAVTGTLDKQSGMLDGDYSGANSSGNFFGTGCKLN